MPAETDGSRIDVWMRRVVALLIAALLGVSCFFVWQLACIAGRIEQSVAATSADLQQVTRTAANISKQIDAVNERIGRLEEKTAEVLRLDQVEAILDQAVAAKKASGNPKPITPEARAEIEHLLSHVRHSGLKFESLDNTRTAWVFYLEMYATYKLQKDTIGSAEEFIETVGTKTVFGNQCFVILKDGSKRPLREWLAEALAAYRTAPKKDGTR